MPRTKGSKNKTTALTIDERIAAVTAEIEALQEQVKSKKAEQKTAGRFKIRSRPEKDSGSCSEKRQNSRRNCCIDSGCRITHQVQMRS